MAKKKKKTFFHILLHIGKILDQVMMDELSAIGLHHGQGRTLVSLLETGEMTQANLARGMDVKPATITNMLKPLEKRKLISRYTDSKTNRAMVVALTPKGKHSAKKVIKIWGEIEKRLEGAVGGGERLLFNQLEGIRGALGGTSPEFIAYNKEI